MNYQRITISVPHHLYKELITVVGQGKVSRFVAEATEARLLEKKFRKKDAVAAFFSHRKGLPKLTDAQIMAAIRKGRT